MDLVELGDRSMDLVDLEFLKLGCLAGKKWSVAIFMDQELRVALPNTPLTDPSIPAAKLEVIVSTGIRFSWHPIFLLLSSYRSYMASFNCLEKKSTDSQIEITGVICTPSSQCV
jgi:hypothetical protein